MTLRHVKWLLPRGDRITRNIVEPLVTELSTEEALASEMLMSKLNQLA